MFKETLLCITNLLSDPSKEWTRLSQNDTCEEKEQKEKHELFLKHFLYPLIGIASLGSFFGGLFASETFSLETPLKRFILTFCSYFGGIHLVAILLKEASNALFQDTFDTPKCLRFSGYLFALPLVISVVLSLFPAFFFLNICNLYVVYLVWKGAEPYMGIPASDKLKYVCITSALVLFIPFFIERMFFFFMPGLQ